ncbi:betaxylosidase [Colletotrichum higginsianum]|nr:betaxylosidase [Colletotrichum higginsianum]
MIAADHLSPWVSLGDVEGDVINFAPNSTVPAHFTHWRYPIETLNGNYAGAEGQTFVGRRQQDTLFSYSVDIDFKPTEVEEEAGVSVFLTQNHHFDLGVVLLPANASTQAFPGQNSTIVKDPDELKLHLRFRGESYAPIPANIVAPVPEGWVGAPLQLEIKAFNMTHYAFSCGPAGAASRMQTLLHASNAALSWGFTGKRKPDLEASIS